VEHLKRSQTPDGHWGELRHAMHLDEDKRPGLAALAGWTLLETGLPAKDPAVQKAAEMVRRHGLTMKYTYSLSLAVLFLDRLGEPADEPLIESLAVRLMAGMTTYG